MYQFNLLPPPYQKAIRKWMLSRHVTAGFGLFNMVFLMFTGLLLSANISLRNILDVESIEVHVPVSDGTADGATSSQELKQRLNQIGIIQQKHPDYLTLTQTILGILPDGIRLSQMTVFYEKTPTITLIGKANHRDQLKNLQYALEQDKRFTIVTFPFEVFTEVENIPFTIELQFDAQSFQVVSEPSPL